MSTAKKKHSLSQASAGVLKKLPTEAPHAFGSQMMDYFKVVPKSGRPIADPNLPKVGRPKRADFAPVAVALHPSRMKSADVLPALKKSKRNWSKDEGLAKIKAAVAGWEKNVQKPQAEQLSMVC